MTPNEKQEVRSLFRARNHFKICVWKRVCCTTIQLNEEVCSHEKTNTIKVEHHKFVRWSIVCRLQSVDDFIRQIISETTGLIVVKFYKYVCWEYRVDDKMLTKICPN